MIFLLQVATFIVVELLIVEEVLEMAVRAVEHLKLVTRQEQVDVGDGQLVRASTERKLSVRFPDFNQMIKILLLKIGHDILGQTALLLSDHHV
jgi:hypothetical protein